MIKKLLMAAVLMPLMVLADTEIVDGIEWTYGCFGDTVFGDQASVMGASPASGAIVIPAELGGRPVTQIDYRAFSGCTDLTSVTIPKYVINIGDRAFSECRELREILVSPENETYASVEGILYDKAKTKIVVFPCGRTGSVAIPEGVLEIGAWQLVNCRIESVSLPSSVERLNTGWSGKSYDTAPPAFYGCSNLLAISVAAGNRIYSSKDGVLYDKGMTRLWVCPNGKVGELTVPEGVLEIGSEAFAGCRNLESVLLPSSVSKIQTTYLTVGNSYLSIEIPPTFAGCSSLQSILVAADNVTYSSRDGILYDKSGSVLLSCPNGRAGTVDIPHDVTGIGSCAFRGCAGIESMLIPSSVTSVGKDAFLGTKLVDEHPEGFVVIDGCLIGYKGNRPNNLDIPDDVRLIADSAFEQITDLQTVTFSSGLRGIGKRAFSGCSGLTSLSIPENVMEIGEYAFFGCTGLTQVSLPSGLEKIEDGVFALCERLQSLSIPGKVTSIGAESFNGCSGLTSVTIPSGVTSIGDGAFESCWGLASVEIPSGVTRIGARAFMSCGNLTSVEISLGVTVIGDYAFEGCENLIEVTIPSSVASIGHLAFASCSRLASVEIPSSVANISDTAFYGCNELADALGFVIVGGTFYQYLGAATSVTLPYGVTRIGGYAFTECSGLTNVVIPEGVMAIGNYAFVGCSGLTDVKLPSSITSIGDSSFYGCSGLADDKGFVIVRDVLYQYLGLETSVTIPDGVTRIGCNAFSAQEIMNVEIPRSVTRVGDYAFNWCSELASMSVSSSVKSIGMAAFYGCRELKTVNVDVGDVDRMRAMMEEGGLDVAGVQFVEDRAKCRLIVPGEAVSIDLGLSGYTAKGLPSGLKYDAKTGKITGAAKAATAAEGVVVKFTKKGAEDEELTIVVRAEEITAGCEGLSSGPLPAGVAGTADGMDIQIDSEGGTKSVSVTKLPSGMKYDKKSGKITGAPTKAGDYEVVLTVTTAYGNKETVKIPVSVAAMPVMAVGTFSGFVSIGEDNLGTVTLTTTDAGKLTAKVVTAAGTVSFSGTCWDAVEDGVYRATLTTKKGEKLTLTLDSTAGWDENQLVGSCSFVGGRTLDVTAQRNAFGKTWYFAAEGNEKTGWMFAYTEDTKGAALTVTLKADGSTSIAGKLPNGTDAKGKAVTIKVSASGYANVGGLKDGAVLADFAPVLTVNKVKTVLAIKTNLWFDRSNDHAEGAGEARFAK